MIKQITKTLVIGLCLTILFPYTAIATSYLGFYNGHNLSRSNYSIGISTSEDMINWSSSSQELLQPRLNLFDSHSLNAPYPVSVGKYVYCYYAAYDGTKWGGIGLAILTDDMRVLSRPRQPVIRLGPPGAWDSTKVFRPIVQYNPNPVDINYRFTMIYTGADANGVNRGGIAYSPDGINWIEHEGNPIISVGVAGSWDNFWVMPENILLVDGAYYMLYNGYDGDKVQTGVATATSLEGPWIKNISNPILSPRPLAVQTLNKDSLVGSTILDVSNSTVFAINEPCLLSSVSGTENVRVKSLPSATTIELYEPTVYSHQNGTAIKSILAKSVGPNQLVHEDGIWKIYGSAWGVIPESSFEITTYAEGADLSSMQWDYENMPTMNYDTVVTSAWDSSSQENLKFIRFNTAQ